MIGVARPTRCLRSSNSLVHRKSDCIEEVQLERGTFAEQSRVCGQTNRIANLKLRNAGTLSVHHLTRVIAHRLFQVALRKEFFVNVPLYEDSITFSLVLRTIFLTAIFLLDGQGFV